MTDKEKLQKLFDAALRHPEPATSGLLKRAFPSSSTTKEEVPATVIPNMVEQHEQPQAAPEPAKPAFEVGAAPTVQTQEPTEPVTESAPALDRGAADELGALLDEKIRTTARKRRRSAIITALVLFGITGGSVGWFVKSPARIEALTSAIQEIRSVGDIKSMVAKFQAALDKVAVRSQQIDQATAAMGVTKTAEDDVDPCFDTEMKQMMGGEGKTVGARNRGLQAAFGNRSTEAGGKVKPTTVISKKDSFDFTN